MEAAHAFAMLKQSLEGELKVMKKQLSEATLQKSSTEEALHAAEGELAETEKTLAADTTCAATRDFLVSFFVLFVLFVGGF